MSKAVNDASLRLTEALRGKKILLSGTTGFLGKVVLSMLLDHVPDVGKVFALIRPGASDRAPDRFAKTVATSEALNPLRERHGEGYADFLASKVVALDGNIVKDDCGITAEGMAMLEREGIDIIINSAGLVDFDPPVDQALAINALGAQNIVKLAQRLDAALVHVSTCFVAGVRSGQVLEDDPIVNKLPPRFAEREPEFDYQREIERLQTLAKEVRERADDPSLRAQWRSEALAKVEEEGRDKSDEAVVRMAVQRQKKGWLATELKRVGMARARFWGWTNTYTFTKSLGEMVIADAAAKGLDACIVRPAIVESALEFPMPGWNEGFTTTAPLILMVRQGLPHFPYAEDLVLDIIPCDMVAGLILGAAAACLAGSHKLVYQAASGDSNPLTIKKALELTAFEARTRARRQQPSGVSGWLKQHYETQPMGPKTYAALSTPRVKQVAAQVKKGVDRVGPDRLGWARQPASWLGDVAEELTKNTTRIGTVMDLFMPFVAENKYVFRSDNVRQLASRIPDDERWMMHWKPEAYAWRDYFVKVHIPGLERWVFPQLEEELAEKPKVAYMHRDLVELFESSTYAHRHRLAFQLVGPDGKEHLTYGELRTLARRVSGHLVAEGVTADDRVVLVAENRPEWAAAYFGILRAGATVVPVDASMKADELVNIVRAAGARGVLLTPKVAERLRREGLAAKGLPSADTKLWPLDVVLRSNTELAQPKDPARVASLIFTSGTTGKPKGVMLSQRNFSFEVSRLAGIFKLDEHDHLLSLLPLHHTFEFTAGLLLPLSRGARITYLSQVNGELLQQALKEGVTGLIGVPALWQLLQRRIETQLEDRGTLARLVTHGARVLTKFSREKLSWNVGPVVAYPVHRALGGRLKYLVSGGSALSPDVMQFFRELGFNLTEGYGLTETAPVLTVTNPNEQVRPGSVGTPLYGVELKIDAPNDDGIGEVLTRGANVMLGYYGNDAATAEVMSDGWLRTGDLGRLDDDGRLYLVGRKKDVIVDADGRNVYPDELEDLYAGHPCIKELSIVGLPTADRGERVAALVVVQDSRETKGADARQAVQDHVRKVSEGLGYAKRIKVLRFSERDLPRTSTRKVKRPEVVRELQRQLDKEHVQGSTHAVVARGTPLELAVRMVAAVTGKAESDVRPEQRLAGDLGFDSLMFVELASALEPHAKDGLKSEQVMAIETVADIVPLLRIGKRGAAFESRMAPSTSKQSIVRARRDASGGESAGVRLPSLMQRAGRSLLGFGQRRFYEGVMDTAVRGRHYIPRDQGFIVAANHASHLDAGLVKVALGEFGNELVALAAKDYFFEHKLRRLYFENFTNLLPIERQGALKDSMKKALAVIERGDTLLVFPEGTRSTDGKLQEFKASIGFLALQARRPVLPMYLWGTHAAMPKGSSLIPKEREIGAMIGPPIPLAFMLEATQGLSRSEAYRLVTRLVERAVHALAERGSYRLDELLDEAPVVSADAKVASTPASSVAARATAAKKNGKAKPAARKPKRTKRGSTEVTP